MFDFENLKGQFLHRLEHELPAYLTYHNAQHTQYVLSRAIEIAKHEKVNGNDLELVKLAALYHDSGFLIQKSEHEALGCKIIKKEFPELGINANDIERVCAMVMATKIPQNPQNILEEIVADADLEYLGTDFFDLGSERLFRELKYENPSFSVKEWLEIQIKFLSAHHYHTDFCIQHREPVKWKHIERLKEKLKSIN